MAASFYLLLLGKISFPYTTLECRFFQKDLKSTLPSVVSQESYGKGPDYFQLKTAICPVSMFLLLFSMKFGTELDNYQYDSFK